MAFFEEKKLPNSTIAFMLIVAGVVDAIQIGLTFTGIGSFVSPILSVGAFMGFWLWFQMYGVSYAKPKRLIPEMIGGIIELIPAIDALPACLASVGWVIFTNRSRFGKSIEALAAGDVVGAATSAQAALSGEAGGPTPAQIAAQQRLALAAQLREEEEYEYGQSNVIEMPRRSNARTEDYSPDFESADSSVRKSYDTNKASSRDSNTLDLRRKKAA